MAIGSLRNFTVPLANNQSASSQGLLMPKLKYRFRATFLNFGVSKDQVELTKQVSDVSRPTANFNPFVIDVYNSKVNLIGKPSWEPITINVRDDAGNNITKLVGEQIQKQFDFAEQASASSGIDYKFQLNIEMLDGGNGTYATNVIETWELYGCFINQVNYGELNYSDGNAPVMVQMQITYDNAVQTPSGVGVGTLVGRNIVGAITG